MNYFIQQRVEPTAVIREKARYLHSKSDDFVGLSSVGSVWFSDVSFESGIETLVLVRDDEGRIKPSKTTKLLDEEGRIWRCVCVPKNHSTFKWKDRWQVLLWVESLYKSPEQIKLAAFDLENFKLRIGSYAPSKSCFCQLSPSALKWGLLDYSGFEGVRLSRSNFDLDRLCPTGPREDIQLPPSTPYFTPFFVSDSGDCLLRPGLNDFLHWHADGTLQSIKEDLDDLWDLGRYWWVPQEGDNSSPLRREECRFVNHRCGISYLELVVTCESHTLRNRCIGRIVQTCFHHASDKTNLSENELERFPDEDSKFVAKSFWLWMCANDASQDAIRSRIGMGLLTFPFE